MRGVVRGVANPERTGLDRLSDLDEDKPVIFAANHHSHVDAPLLITSVPEPWRHRLVVGAAADYFFATRFTGALSALAMGAIPIDRSRVNRRSGDLAAELLEDRWSILIFPEGGRSPDGWGQPFRGGAAYLSVRTGAPVVPIHLEGTGRIMGRGMNRPRPGRTLVTFGTPLLPRTRRRRALTRGPHRAGRLPARRRGRDRLVGGEPACGPRRDADADRP